MDNRSGYGLVHVILDDGTEGTVYVGGSVEVFYNKGTVKVFIKRKA